MNQTDPWVVTYKDFQGCTERLTDEVDRLTSQTRAATAVLESSAKCTEHVEAVGMQIAQQVKNAEMAWSKADEVAVQAARQAHSAAFKGVEDSIKSVVAAVSRSAQQNANAAEQIGQSARQARGSIYYLSAGFLVIAALGVPRLSSTLKSKRSAQARMAEGVKMEVRQGQDAKAAWLTTAARQARPILKAF